MARKDYSMAPIGATFGLWTVLDYSHSDNEHYWLVQCGCGIIEPRRAGQLMNKRTASCRTCAAIGREAARSPYWKSHNEISYQYLARLKYRNKPTDLTMENLYDKWVEQEGKCALSGIKLSLVFRDTKWTESTASIDRIDSTIGYFPTNIQWVHKTINRMKGNLSDEEFIYWCDLVTKRGGVCGS